MLRISRYSLYSARTVRYKVQARAVICEHGNLLCSASTDSTVDQGYRFQVSCGHVSNIYGRSYPQQQQSTSYYCRVQHCSRRAYITRACRILRSQRVSNRTVQWTKVAGCRFHAVMSAMTVALHRLTARFNAACRRTCSSTRACVAVIYVRSQIQTMAG